jgi:predicted TIM-barrel fold metal-dependent hydrolase
VIFDAWVNANPPQWRKNLSPIHQEALERLFDQREEAVGGVHWEQQLEMMDDAGVDVAMLTALTEFVDDIEQAAEYMAGAREAHPDRFLISAGVEPRDGMQALAKMERLAANYDVRLFRLIPYWVGHPPNHAIYYPVYAKAVELGIPVSVNIGMPGPRVPGLVQHPAALDEVLIHFPDLRVVGCHMGHPWIEEVVALLVRHPNFYLMTSAWAPRYYPEPILHYAASRGIGRIMFASDYPAIPIKRCIEEAARLPLEGRAREEFMGSAAARLFGLTPSDGGALNRDALANPG